ncbi:MAG TPA: hypothetical protein VFK10_07255, partial [Burkholderiaceae bacterium]|nr:hypothetical protein [Burkholderiaceae bacterium]
RGLPAPPRYASIATPYGAYGRSAWPPWLPLGRSATGLWWLHPVACALILLAVYATYMWFDFKRVVPTAYLPGWYYAWGAGLLVAMAIGMVTMTAGRALPPPVAVDAIDVPAWAMGVLLIGALFAYSVWFAPLVSDPRLLVDILQGERSSVRGVITTTPGVTTMTQFGLAYAIAYAAMRASGARPLEGWETVGLWVVFALAVVRSIVWSERLAVIELVVTYAVARLTYTRITTERWWRIAGIAALAAPPLVYVAFTGTEFIRSWDYYRNEYDSVWQFSFERLIAYYATAANNGIGLLTENGNWPLWSGRFVAEWLYLMPEVGDWLRESLGDPMTYYTAFLDRFARPEFNSATGLFPVVFDLGYTGSMLYFVAVGALIGQLWDSWRRQSAAGVLFYPLAVMFLVELLRFNYFASTRCFPVVIALLFLWAVSRPAMPPSQPSAAW